MTENIETNMTTEELLAQRQQVYGDRVDNMTNVGTMWSGYLRARFPDVDITATDVCVMMALYKEYRMSVEPEYSDSIDDVDGYMNMAREMIGDNLIQARTVDEFIRKRAERDQPFEGVQLVKRYLTPEELDDPDTYVNTIDDIGEMLEGGATFAPTESAFTDEERAAAELERRNRAYNRTVEQAEQDEVLEAFDSKVKEVKHSALSQSILNAERTGVGLRPLVVEHELKLCIVRCSAPTGGVQNALDTMRGVDVLFRDVFIRDRARSESGYPALQDWEITGAVNMFKGLNNIASHGMIGMEVLSLLKQDRAARQEATEGEATHG